MLDESEVRKMLDSRVDCYKYWKETLRYLREEGIDNLNGIAEKWIIDLMGIYKGKVAELCIVLGEPIPEIFLTG